MGGTYHLESCEAAATLHGPYHHSQARSVLYVLRQAYSAVPVLYASQWLLTCFACPFSAPVACRVIDALLLENRPHCLLRVALALLAELEPDLLALDDFEELITFIKARLHGNRV